MEKKEKKVETKAQAATQAPAEAPAEKKAPIIKVQKLVQNNVVRPGVGTKTARVWEIADEISRATKAPASRADVMNKGVAEGLNSATLATQYGLWRVYNGLTGDKVPKAPKVEKPKKEKKTKAADTPPPPVETPADPGEESTDPDEGSEAAEGQEAE